MYHMYTSGIGFCFIRDLVSNLKVFKKHPKGCFFDIDIYYYIMYGICQENQVEYDEFVKVVKDKRKQLDLSQEKLGLLIWPDKSPAAAQRLVSHIEKGVYRINPKIVGMICRHLKITPVPKVENIDKQEVVERKIRNENYRLFSPEMSSDDLELVSGNLTLMRVLEQEFASIIRDKCTKLREALGISKSPQ